MRNFEWAEARRKEISVVQVRGQDRQRQQQLAEKKGGDRAAIDCDVWWNRLT